MPVNTRGRITLYAQWSANSYEITFNANGGSVSPTKKSVTFGSAYGTLPTPERNGYQFTGWYTQATGGTEITSTNIVSISANQTLYAQWTQAIYVLTVNPNGGSFNGSTSTTTYTGKEADIMMLPTPSRTGYTFNGWTTSTSNGSITKYGTGLYNDDTFASGTNSMTLYNNLYNGNITMTRVAKSSDSPYNNTSYMMQFKTTGTVTPGLGGFYQNTISKANGIFYHVVVAKIPVGYTIHQANNSVGTNGSFTWLTERGGTGEWETYIYRANNGSTGSFSSFGHVYIVGTEATVSSPVTWYVSYANIFDATNGTNVENASQLFTYQNGNQTLTAKWTANNYYFDLNGYLDGALNGGITGYGTADVYINGSLVCNDCDDYYQQHPYGTTYQITDIKASSGRTYKGVNSGSLSGTITGETKVELAFNTSFTSRDFAYTGGIQTFTVPVTGTYKLEVWGAQGGASGGRGGYSYGNISLTSGQTLYIVVGGSSNGYNGGGSAYGDTGAGSGGGATHIATSTGLLSALSSNKSAVKIVAGGGGGSATWGGCSESGGSGGGSSGGSGISNYGSGFDGSTKTNPTGGTQSAGGGAGYAKVDNEGASGGRVSAQAGSGSFGKGGNGAQGDYGGNGAGGGGGYYGGGGGAGTYSCGSGAGGSGYIGGVSGGSMSSGVQSGNGKAKISFVG